MRPRICPFSPMIAMKVDADADEDVFYDPTMRPAQRSDGTWDALDNHGYGHSLGYASAELVEAWLDGYDTGARENM